MIKNVRKYIMLQVKSGPSASGVQYLNKYCIEKTE